MKYVLGDLLETDCSHIIHGCNAQRRMASGVAKAIRAKWPRVYDDYMKAPRELMEPGNIIWTAINEDNSPGCGPYRVVSAITQKFYGYDKRRYVSYDAIDLCLRTMLNGADISHPADSTFAMPQIGAGLGGGDWKAIAAIIERIERDTGKEFSVYINDPGEYEKWTHDP